MDLTGRTARLRWLANADGGRRGGRGIRVSQSGRSARSVNFLYAFWHPCGSFFTRLNCYVVSRWLAPTVAGELTRHQPRRGYDFFGGLH